MAKSKPKNDRPTPRRPGESVLEWHLRELLTLQSRLEPEHIARETIEQRITECREAINVTVNA